MATHTVVTDLELNYDAPLVTQHERANLREELERRLKKPDANVFTPYVNIYRDGDEYKLRVRGYGRTDILLVQFYGRGGEADDMTGGRHEHVCNVFIEVAAEAGGVGHAVLVISPEDRTQQVATASFLTWIGDCGDGFAELVRQRGFEKAYDTEENGDGHEWCAFIDAVSDILRRHE